MRNDVKKMNNFQNNIQQSNQFNNILYILIVLLFEGKNPIFISLYSPKFCPFLNTKQIFFLPYFIYIHLFMNKFLIH